MSHVFISYQQNDSDFAEVLINRILMAGFTTWTDSDRLHAGEDWRNEIDEAIKDSFALIVIMTPEAKVSEYITYEWVLASASGVKVIPVMLKPTPLHPRLEALQYLDFTDRSLRPWQALINVLRNTAIQQNQGSLDTTLESTYIHKKIDIVPDSTKVANQKSDLKSPTIVDHSKDGIEIFFSYAHRDEMWRKELDKQLSFLKWQSLISSWYDRQIDAGTEWESEISKHLESAQIILLLISPAFMASPYCYSIELIRAIERHNAGEARVIPIILRSTDWHGAPFGNLPALPKDGKPISKWTNQDEAFLNVAKGIRRVVEDLRKNA